MTKTTKAADQTIKVDSLPNCGAIVVNFPKPKWIVTIPKNGEFCISYTKHLNWWARMWMRFIGWEVTKVDNNEQDR